MSYALRDKENLGEGIRRIICRQIEAAMEASVAESNGKTSPVHETRKHLKKARAALAMISREVVRTHFKRERCRLRRVARLISEVRDAEVRLQTIKELRHACPGNNNRNFRETEELLAFELDSFLAAFSDWQEEAKAKLARVRGRIADWPLDGVSCTTIRHATQQSYKRGRKALQLARRKPTPENFHSFRKEVKRLFYQLQIMRRLQPLVFEEVSNEVKVIGQHLGDAHDLCFLGERLKAAGRTRSGKRGQKVLKRLIDARQKDLYHTAAVLGERFYAQRPRDFGRRISEYMAEWNPARPRQDSLKALAA